MDKCIAVMEDLDHLPVNHVMLKKNPDIMNTIKKVGKLKKNIVGEIQNPRKSVIKSIRNLGGF